MLVNRTTKPKERLTETTEDVRVCSALVAAWTRKSVSYCLCTAGQHSKQSVLLAWHSFAGLKLEWQLLIVHFSTVTKMYLFLISSNTRGRYASDANGSDIISLHTIYIPSAQKTNTNTTGLPLFDKFQIICKKGRSSHDLQNNPFNMKNKHKPLLRLSHQENKLWNEFNWVLLS